MYKNVGEKCKSVAKLFCWLGIIASVIGGLFIFQMPTPTGDLTVLYGIMTMLIGSLFSWLSSLGLYAIGEAAENSAIAADLAIKAQMKSQEEKQEQCP